jgi:hypothetical protein
MNVHRTSRLLALAAGLLLIGTVACVDSPTGPQVKGKRSLRDTTVLEGDSTLCRSGWHISGNRVVCNAEQ